MTAGRFFAAGWSALSAEELAAQQRLNHFASYAFLAAMIVHCMLSGTDSATPWAADRRHRLRLSRALHCLEVLDRFIGCVFLYLLLPLP